MGVVRSDELKNLKHLPRLFTTLLAGELRGALIRTFFIRGLVAIGGVIFLILIGRLYGPEGVGSYAIASSILIGVGIFVRYGKDNTLIRYVGRDINSPYVADYFFWSLKTSIPFSIAAGAVLFLSRDFLESAFSAEGLSSILVGISFASPAFIILFLFSGFLKGVRKPATASMMENGMVALITAMLLFVIVYFSPVFSFCALGWAYAASAWAVLIAGVIIIRLWIKKQSFDGSKSQKVPESQLSSTSRSFFVLSLSSFTQTVLVVLISGALLKNADLGLFKSAQQMSLLINFILLVINTIFPPRFAELYHNGDMVRLEILAKKGVLVGLALAMPLLVLCIIFPAWLLGWFGEEFHEAAPLLRILAIAQLVNVATGSVGFLLNMTGHEKLMRNIALFSNALGLALLFVFIPLWGVLGAALALALVIVGQNMLALYFVWKRLKIWTLPGPNWFAFLSSYKNNR